MGTIIENDGRDGGVIGRALKRIGRRGHLTVQDVIAQHAIDKSEREAKTSEVEPGTSTDSSKANGEEKKE